MEFFLEGPIIIRENTNECMREIEGLFHLRSLCLSPNGFHRSRNEGLTKIIKEINNRSWELRRICLGPRKNISESDCGKISEKKRRLSMLEGNHRTHAKRKRERQTIDNGEVAVSSTCSGNVVLLMIPNDDRETQNLQ